ncbi:MAG: alpha/beta hydrolase [Phormidesmis sp.]
MYPRPDVLYLAVSPHLKCFDQRLMLQLSKSATVRQWRYLQTIDEPCSPELVVKTLHEYMQSRSEATADSTAILPKVHLIGHGVSGVIGLLYARQYPQHVASLTLLSVSATPAMNWQAHYYALRKLLPCSREVILGQMIRLLCGQQSPRFTTALAQLLAHDLDSNLTLHSLAHSTQVVAGGAEVPLLICQGELDEVTASPQVGWECWLKAGDRIWQCPEGKHFFQFHHYQQVAKVITQYWAQLQRSQLPSQSHSPDEREDLATAASCRCRCE